MRSRHEKTADGACGMSSRLSSVCCRINICPVSKYQHRCLSFRIFAMAYSRPEHTFCVIKRLKFPSLGFLNFSLTTYTTNLLDKETLAYTQTPSYYPPPLFLHCCISPLPTITPSTPPLRPIHAITCPLPPHWCGNKKWIVATLPSNGERGRLFPSHIQVANDRYNSKRPRRKQADDILIATGDGCDVWDALLISPCMYVCMYKGEAGGTGENGVCCFMGAWSG